MSPSKGIMTRVNCFYFACLALWTSRYVSRNLSLLAFRRISETHPQHAQISQKNDQNFLSVNPAPSRRY